MGASVSLRLLALESSLLPHCAGKAGDVDPSRAGSSQRRRAGGRGGTGRVDVVDEADAGRAGAARKERTGDIGAPSRPRQVALADDAWTPLEQRGDGNLPDRGELARERARRGVPSLQLPVPVARNEREHVDRGPGQRDRDDLGGDRGQVAATALLPRCDERPRVRLVDDGGPSAGEGQPPAAALGAAAHRPRPRGAAALAPRRSAAEQARPAPVAERRADPAADAAAPWQEDVEERHDRTVETSVCRHCAGTVPGLA